jgi:hypothetical protein
VWKWLTIFGLAAAPALILGQSAAWVAGFGWGMNVPLLGIVIVLGGFAEGIAFIELARMPARSERFKRWVTRVETSRFARWCTRRGPWPGLLLATAVFGQEPPIIALVWFGVPRRKLVLPLLVTNVIYTVIYAVLVRQGLTDWDKLMSL